MEIPSQISAEVDRRSCLDAVGGVTTIVKAAHARLCHKLSRRFRLHGYRLGPGQRPGRKNPMAQGRRPDQAEASRTRRLHGRGRGRPRAARSLLGCSRANIVFGARTQRAQFLQQLSRYATEELNLTRRRRAKKCEVGINHLTNLVRHGWLCLAGAGWSSAGWASSCQIFHHERSATSPKCVALPKD
jgi:hypothetical protein